MTSREQDLLVNSLLRAISSRTRCLILDDAMPVMSGPDLHLELRRRGEAIPTVFITAHSDLRMRLLTEGAVECLLKPFSEAALLEALRTAAPSGSRPKLRWR